MTNGMPEDRAVHRRKGGLEILLLDDPLHTLVHRRKGGLETSAQAWQNLLGVHRRKGGLEKQPIRAKPLY